MDVESTSTSNNIQVNPHSIQRIPESALCMKCFRPFCDVICKGSCSRTYHSCCIGLQGGKSKSWKCPLCSTKEIDKYSKSLHVAKEESSDRNESLGSGFSQLVLLDTVVSHKKRDIYGSKSVKCTECDKRYKSQYLRCTTCGSLYHRGCLPINSIPVSSRFVVCPNHFQSSGNDYLHSSLKDQFNKLKGTTDHTGRGGHLMKGRGRGRGRGSIGGNRGGRGGKRLTHLIMSDPTLSNTKVETIVCERCGKIRKYPGYINRKYLPQHWFCEYDVWNKKQTCCECDANERSKHEEERNDDNPIIHAKMIQPAIWGGENAKINNKFVPSSLSSIDLILYFYFSKIAQKTTQRINYLDFVSSSYAFNHNLDTNQEVTQLLSENKNLSQKSQSILSYFHSSPSLSIHDIMNDKCFFSSIFENQKSLLTQCIRYLQEKNLIIFLDKTNHTDDSRFIINDIPSSKGESINTIRIRQENNN